MSKENKNIKGPDDFVTRPSQGLIDMMNGGWEEKMKEKMPNMEPVYYEPEKELLNFVETLHDSGLLKYDFNDIDYEKLIRNYLKKQCKINEQI